MVVVVVAVMVIIMLIIVNTERLIPLATVCLPVSIRLTDCTKSVEMTNLITTITPSTTTTTTSESTTRPTDTDCAP